MKPNQIRTFRRRHYGSQAALAKAVGVSQAAVSQWESGARRPGGAAMQMLIALRAAKNGEVHIARTGK